ncbi:MAG: ATP-grasp domain-containing protein [Planctomycetaceae bacterium]|jgi:carbamoyl-phosphate synthase large subunit|nr:ATP-grasp domain-containing protein [Planctomycetaceae bacterium]
MNILFSCAGRRNYLIRFFREALNGTGMIIATDMNLHASAMIEADAAEVVPEVYAPDYIDKLIEICCRHKVQTIIPLNDLELPILANSKSRFQEINIMPLVSDCGIIDICFDKWKTSQFIQKIGLKVPRTYIILNEAIKAIELKQLYFPLVVKPRWGSGSVGIEFVYDIDELQQTYQLVNNKVKHSILNQISQNDITHAVLIQEKINGTEFGIDIINDLKGNYITTITKKKLAMRAGETDKAITVENALLSQIGQILGESLKHIANLDCDVFESEGSYYVLEMNPRFGGGYPFSQMAGTNLPAAILDWLNGKIADPKYFQFQTNVIFAKCDTLVQLS